MKMPTYFLSHGGGPWPFMKEQTNGAYDQLEASLKALPAQLPQRPKAILVVTAHWETQDFKVSSSAAPGMIYDYGGFPEHTYHIQYPAPGSPALAQRVAELLNHAGLPTNQDATRGFDHGTFSMLAPIYPQADMPVVQLSIQRSFDPALHIAAGRALAPLREEGILILGSGLSYHNLRAFGPAGGPPSHAFDAWLRETLLELPPEAREFKLLNWASAPAARIAHPREDHLVPLFVVHGAAETERASMPYHEDAFFGSLAVSSFQFGENPA